MNEHDRQKMKEMIKKAVDMNRALLDEFDSLLNENKQLEDENKKWREYFESGSQIYKKNQPNRPRQ
jgi:cell shape-determining protein MreC